MPMRPPSRVLRKSLSPSPSAPSRFPAGNSTVLEDQLAGVAGMEAHLLLHASDAEAGCIGFHDERADLARSGLAVGDGGDDVGARHARVGDEPLPAIEDPVLAIPMCPGPRAARVAPRARLGEPVGADDLAGGHRPQIALLLLVGSGKPDRIAAEAGVGADDDPDTARHAGELLDGDRVGERVQTGTTDLLRIWDAEEPERCRFADDLGRKLALPLHLICRRRDPLLGEVAHGAADLLVLRGQGEVHRIRALRCGFGDSGSAVYKRTTRPLVRSGRHSWREGAGSGGTAPPINFALAAPLLGPLQVHAPDPGGDRTRSMPLLMIELRHRVGTPAEVSVECRNDA